MADNQRHRRGKTGTGRGDTPRMYRRRSGRIVAGVAGGLADHLGVRVFWVRLVFALLCLLGSVAPIGYGLLWVFVAQRRGDAADATDAAVSHRERQQGIGLLVLGIGLTVVGGSASGMLSGWAAVPVAVAVIGAVVVWREADESQRRRKRSGTSGGVLGRALGGGGPAAAVRIVAGVVLVATAIVMVVVRNGSFEQVRFALLAVLAALVGVAVLTVPFWLRMVRDLGEERRARIRTEERAAIAAHLHDSVLQTLALIQKQAESPREVARLSRRQERELRTWLYGPDGYGGSSATDGTEPSAGAGSAEGPDAPGTSGQHATGLSEALAEACAEVEDSFGVTVRPVVVGDVAVDDALLALVRAGREAAVNAAKHAGVDEISVYAEVERSRATLFVRDRGAGFDPDSVGSDRHGLADSVRGRIEAQGGSCRVRTAPGEGTEVQLELPLRSKGSEKEGEEVA